MRRDAGRRTFHAHTNTQSTSLSAVVVVIDGGPNATQSLSPSLHIGPVIKNTDSVHNIEEAVYRYYSHDHRHWFDLNVHELLHSIHLSSIHKNEALECKCLNQMQSIDYDLRYDLRYEIRNRVKM